VTFSGNESLRPHLALQETAFFLLAQPVGPVLGRVSKACDVLRSPHGSRKLDLHTLVGTRRWAPRSSGARSHACRYRQLPSNFFARNRVCANGCSYTIRTCCLLFIKSRDDRCQAEQKDKACRMAGEAAVARAKKGRTAKPRYASSKPWDRYRRRHVRQGIRK
jgi:hypothetical protein